MNLDAIAEAAAVCRARAKYDNDILFQSLADALDAIQSRLKETETDDQQAND